MIIPFDGPLELAHTLLCGQAFRWRPEAVRKRRTEVDPLLGAVAAEARRLGLATPALDCLVGLVHDIESGRRGLSADTFHVLLDRCHALANATPR